ncbi:MULTISPECIES: ATP-binding protein [Methylorubrum]|uniref:ATP-binding protein n=1 Tax=Methylorubrum TaxID=2282523 RepID=UPI00209E1DD0|nr:MULTISPECIES: ATP-binding protein [Methylorubrum]MCP1548438.1 type II secretory pathway predicted ATPase ExeA [Methylorubrum zatmanii]MCP1554947.1 type II secretory pathway predicted ATPase ExeA [Methylorubrum extorquens]MCP1578741.1 type II secretory pathway predicted ATPase ExeA [Methylorubrum extorquens]
MSDDVDAQGHVQPGVAGFMDDDNAYLRTLRERMPARSQAILARLDQVNEVYVTCRRDTILAEAFETFMEDFLSTSGGRRREADIFFLTGESGAGKTAAVGRLLRQNPVLQPTLTSFGTVRPYVSVKLSGYTLPRIVAQQIISESGHRVKAGTRQGDAWNEMSPALRRRRVILVHIDEVQHLIRNDGTDLARIADAIKGVSIASDWPVAFVLSGLPGIRALAKKDEQFERRARWVHFPDLTMPEEEGLVIRILKKLSEASGLGIGSMADTDMPCGVSPMLPDTVTPELANLSSPPSIKPCVPRMTRRSCCAAISRWPTPVGLARATTTR